MSDPFDHLPAEDDLLAVLALLDGTATVEDEARVHSNPDLVALLETMTAQRDGLSDLRDVAAPDGAREAAVSAALAVFDDETGAPDTDGDAGGAAASTATVVRFERRRRWATVVTGAAAAGVAALFVGALALGGLGGSDQDESASLATSAAADSEAAKVDGGAADAPTAAMTESAPASTAAGDAFDTAAGGQTEADSSLAPAATLAAGATETTAAASDGTVDVLEGPAAVDAAAVVSIATPEQLRDWAQTQQGLIPLPGLGLPCVADGAVAVGEVLYQGTAAVVVRDADGTLTAFDPQTACSVVATVEP
jgi:hypothetical protein